MLYFGVQSMYVHLSSHASGQSWCTVCLQLAQSAHCISLT